MVLTLSILGSIFSLGGNILIALKKKSGWLAWIVGNILWIAVNIIDTMNVPMVVMYCVYMVINVIGFIKWHRAEWYRTEKIIDAFNKVPHINAINAEQLSQAMKNVGMSAEEAMKSRSDFSKALRGFDNEE